MIFYLFRHGETDWNREQRIQGSTNIPLNATGIEQAKSLIPLFQSLKPEIIISSDLQRAFDTGNIIASALNIPIRADKRLREASFGEAEGKTLSDIKNIFEDNLWERFKTFNPENENLRFPGGESRGESVQRMKAVIEELIQENTYNSIGISTHGGVVRNLLHSFLPPGTRALEIPNCVTYQLEFSAGEFRVSGPLK